MSAETFECPDCWNEAPWTDGPSIVSGDDADEFWCQHCGAETPLSADEAARLS